MALEEIEALLDRYGYPCQNDASKDCPRACPFHFSTPGAFASGLTVKKKTIKDLETMLRERSEARARLQSAERGARKATFEDAATSAALQVHAMIVREEVWEGKRRPCSAYPDAGTPKKTRRKHS